MSGGQRALYAIMNVSTALDFRDFDSVRRGLGVSDGFLAGWGHHLAFDLFVGHWIREAALVERRSSRAALLLTWMAGPAGLTLFLGQRAASR